MSYGIAMYLPGKGHTQYGPGTGMIQRINWTTGQEAQMRGLGGNCCQSCKDGGKCSSGLGLFETGMDLTGWGWPEYAIAAFAVLGTFQMWTGTKRAGRAVSGAGRSARRKVGGAISGKGGSGKKKGSSW